MALVVVTATSFCKNPDLKARLQAVVGNKLDIRFGDPSISYKGEPLFELIKDADAVIVGREPMDRGLLSRLPKLRLVAKYGVGMDNIDEQACRDLAKRVISQQGVNADEVAELTIGLMIAVTRRIAETSALLHQGVWDKNGGTNFSGKVIGVIGCGHVGSRVARLARAFGCQVLIHDIVDKTAFAQEIGGRLTSFEETLSLSDIVSVHVPLTPLTRRLLSRDAFKAMKRGSFFINTSRGEVVDESALKWALRSGNLRGAALDVYETEPLADKELFALPQLVLTPHIAAASQEAMAKMGEAAIQAINEFFT